jgi:hypothetical protein
MDDNAAPGNQSEYTECRSNTFADDDTVCSTIVTRAAQQVIDLTVNRACSVNDNNLAQSSPKRQRISDDAMIMKPSMKAPPDAAILELKIEYKARFGHLPRGRFASTSSWLTSAIANKNRLTSTSQSIAHVSTSQTLLIPETKSDPPHIGSQFKRKWLAVGLSTIPASDYSFAAGDKGVTFAASTAGSVHIKTIATDGMAARLFGCKLQIGCMVISIQGPNISDETMSGETDALAIVQAHALLSCILTISAPPDDTISWMTDTVADTRPSDLLGNTLSGYSDRQNASTITIRPGTTDNQDFEATQLRIPSNREAGATVGAPNVEMLSDNLHYSNRQLTGAELHRQYGHLGFDELDAPVVTTDEYGLSDRDGYEMG